MRIPLAVSLDIQAFSGSGITDYNAGATNTITIKTNGRTRTTQRPSIDITEDSNGAGLSHLNDRARGIYYWETNATLYIIHDNDVYSGDQQTGSDVGNISTGTERVTILETLGTNRMVILDAENDEGWVMSTGETVTAIASNFPTTLCHGGAILDTYLFVMDEDGIIYNSRVNEPTIFDATSFINSERDNDKGVYLGKHHDNLVSFGTRTMGFFYDAGNSTGSPLNRRQDIFYNVGLTSGLSIAENGDVIYFLGSDPSGQISLYELRNFQLRIITSEGLNAYFTEGLTQSGLNILLNSVTFMGHDTVIINVYTLTGASPGTILPQMSLSIDVNTGQEGFIKTNVNSHTTFPLMAWTKRTGGSNATLAARTGEGILYNGDIIEITDNLMPVDTILGTDGVYVSGVYETDVYVATSVDSGENIPLIIRTGLQDAGTSNYKFQNRESLKMDSTDNTQTVTIKHSDELSDSFDSGNTIDPSLDRKEIYSCSRFIKRNYQVEYSGDEQIFLDELVADIEVGL